MGKENGALSLPIARTQAPLSFGEELLLNNVRLHRPESSQDFVFLSGANLEFVQRPSQILHQSVEIGVRDPHANMGGLHVLLAANWTYTGLFNIRRLVADEDFHSLLRTQDTQSTRLGSDVESRFWISCRPYEAKDDSREWFIGPVLTWLYSQDESISGAIQPGTGGNVLLAGVTTYVRVRPGMHVWLGADWDIAHSTGSQFMPVRNHISFGITQQFRMHF